MSGAINLLVQQVGSVSPLNVSLNRSSLGGYTYTPGTATTSQSTTCTAAGGVPPYTYLWEFVSGGGDSNPISDTSATTKFSAFFSSADSTSDVYRCKVTDFVSTVVYSANVSVQLIGL